MTLFSFLVRRYADLSPAYIKKAIEQVSSFGKGKTSEEEVQSLKVEIVSASNGTVAKTGNLEKEEVGKGV